MPLLIFQSGELWHIEEQWGCAQWGGVCNDGWAADIYNITDVNSRFSPPPPPLLYITPCLGALLGPASGPLLAPSQAILWGHPRMAQAFCYDRPCLRLCASALPCFCHGTCSGLTGRTPNIRIRQNNYYLQKILLDTNLCRPFFLPVIHLYQ